MLDKSELTLARVAHHPLPGMNAPTALRFSPDGTQLTYLWSEDGTLVRQLWSYEIQTGATRLAFKAPGQGDTDANVSVDEALRRERLRMRGFGITSYAWAKEKQVMLVPMLGRLVVWNGGPEVPRELNTDGETIDPQLDPPGDQVAFVRDGELRVLSLEPGAVSRQLTFDASTPNAAGERLVTNGLAEFIAQEEMGRSSGFWWSPAGTEIAFAQVDCSDVLPYPISHLAAEKPITEMHRYPFAGEKNARVNLGIVDTSTLERRFLTIPASEDSYLARVDWAPDGGLLVQILSRDQRSLELLRYDAGSDVAQSLLVDRAPDWVNLHDDLRFVRGPERESSEYRIVWSSEKEGYRHLYLLDRDGRETTELTRGDWPVDRVIDVSEQWIYFLAGRETPLERHVFRVSLDGEVLEQLTDTSGVHAAVLSPSGELFADAWDSMTQPPSVCLRAAGGALCANVFEGDVGEAEALQLEQPELLTIRTDDGATLYACFYAALGTEGKSPLVVSVYGGPHVQQVVNSWAATVDLRSQYLARAGFCVLKLDNRGSARRGHAFEAAIFRDLGNLEVGDQALGVSTLADRLAIDPQRVGVYGWSYGGYMALMCMLKLPGVFKVGVAGAPVTDWDGYDTNYTERYMMTPAENPRGYQASSALHHVAGLRGKLLILHGMIDENVHFRHTARLIDALVRVQKPFDVLPFPNERHMPRREEDRVYMEQRIVDHFRRYL